MIAHSGYTRSAMLVLAGMLSFAAMPIAAQEVETIDPDAAYGDAIDGDLAGPPERQASASPSEELPADPVSEDAVTYSSQPPATGSVADWSEEQVTGPEEVQNAEAQPETGTLAANATSDTYGEDDLIGAAEGLFGKGAEGLARMIEKMLAKQGEPNAYIVGREAGGAFAVGVRYGSGTLHHKVEGERKVYWTGPSIGFDVGANAANTFVLVYNLYDSEELYERYPAGEGQAYVVGGLTASYLRKGDVVLIPIRMGAGLRLGVNAGYMKFSKKQRWLPF